MYVTIYAFAGLIPRPALISTSYPILNKTKYILSQILSLSNGWRPKHPRRPDAQMSYDLKPEVDEDAAEVLVVFFDAEIQLFDLGALEKTKHALLQLAASLTGDDLDERDALFHGFADDPAEFRLNGAAFIKNFMQIQLDLSHHSFGYPTVWARMIVWLGRSFIAFFNVSLFI